MKTLLLFVSALLTLSVSAAELQLKQINVLGSSTYGAIGQDATNQSLLIGLNATNHITLSSNALQVAIDNSTSFTNIQETASTITLTNSAAGTDVDLVVSGDVTVGDAGTRAVTVSGTANPSIYIYDTDGNAQLYLAAQGANARLYNVYSQGSIALGTASTDRLTIDKDGGATFSGTLTNVLDVDLAGGAMVLDAGTKDATFGGDVSADKFKAGLAWYNQNGAGWPLLERNGSDILSTAGGIWTFYTNASESVGMVLNATGLTVNEDVTVGGTLTNVLDVDLAGQALVIDAGTKVVSINSELRIDDYHGIALRPSSTMLGKAYHGWVFNRVSTSSQTALSVLGNYRGRGDLFTVGMSDDLNALATNLFNITTNGTVTIGAFDTIELNGETGDATFGGDVTVTGDITANDFYTDSITSTNVNFLAREEPDNPSAGFGSMWLSDGNGFGDAGDWAVKENHGGTLTTNVFKAADGGLDLSGEIPQIQLEVSTNAALTTFIENEAGALRVLNDGENVSATFAQDKTVLFYGEVKLYNSEPSIRLQDSDSDDWYFKDIDGDLVFDNNATDSVLTLTQDGDLSVAGTLTLGTVAWNDVRIPISTLSSPSSQPDKVNWLGGIYAYGFDNGTDEQVFFELQVPHGVSTNDAHGLRLHIHYTGTTADATSNVVWGCEYVIASPNEAFPSSTTTIYATNGVAAIRQHEIAAFPQINFDAESAVMSGRFFRDADNADDVYGADAVALSLDAHFPMIAIGSEGEYGDY